MWYVTPTTSPPPFPLSPASSHPDFFFPSLINPPLIFLPLPFTRPPASAPVAGSLPIAKDVSAQRCCVIPGDGEPVSQGGCWWWSESEWVERPQEKPQRVFLCHSVCVGVNSRPMGQHSVSCRSNNGRADPYTWTYTNAHTHGVFVSVQQLTSTRLGSAGLLLFKALCVQPVWRVSH